MAFFTREKLPLSEEDAAPGKASTCESNDTGASGEPALLTDASSMVDALSQDDRASTQAAQATRDSYADNQHVSAPQAHAVNGKSGSAEPVAFDKSSHRRPSAEDVLSRYSDAEGSGYITPRQGLEEASGLPLSNGRSSEEGVSEELQDRRQEEEVADSTAGTISEIAMPSRIDPEPLKDQTLGVLEDLDAFPSGRNPGSDTASALQDVSTEGAAAEAANDGPLPDIIAAANTGTSALSTLADVPSSALQSSPRSADSEIRSTQEILRSKALDADDSKSGIAEAAMKALTAEAANLDQSVTHKIEADSVAHIAESASRPSFSTPEVETGNNISWRNALSATPTLSWAGPEEQPGSTLVNGDAAACTPPIPNDAFLNSSESQPTAPHSTEVSKSSASAIRDMLESMQSSDWDASEKHAS